MERHHYLEIIGITEGDREVAEKLCFSTFLLFSFSHTLASQTETEITTKPFLVPGLTPHQWP